MELTNEFEVHMPVDEAWRVLTDIERIAPCLPGAQLQEAEGDEYRGRVKVKVGPITAQYKGKAHFVELDDTEHRAVLTASGRDTRGQGNANATVTAILTDQGDRTHVSVVTDLTLTGKVAQFGRGVLADVSNNLMGQFVENLESTVSGDGESSGGTHAEEPTETPDEPATSGPRAIDHPEPEPVDLVEHAGSPVVRRVLPIVAVVVGVGVLVWLVRRRRR